MQHDLTAICQVINPDAPGDWLIVCEHASYQMPAEVNHLGLEPIDRTAHIAWDPGAAAVATALAEKLSSTAVLHNYSRLLYDCNRPPGTASAIPSVSESTSIPGNLHLSAASKQARIDTYYAPFHHTIDKLLAAQREQKKHSMLITIHSFTRTYKGEPRRVELGIINDTDKKLATALLGALADSPWLIAANEPYSAADGVTHMLQRHGTANNIPNVMIEIRNDLLQDQAQQAAWACLLTDALDVARRDLEI